MAVVLDDDGSVIAYLDGQELEPKSCPKSNQGNCPICNVRLDSHYGFAGRYGLGYSNICPECSTIYDFLLELF